MITKLDSEFSQINVFLNDEKPSKLFILVDENTHLHCLPTLLGNLETDLPFEIIEIEAGEDLKTINSASQIWEILAEYEADRKALLINLGGGVITDLGGFVASTYKRGIHFINIPTTLLGMCDASIGGKTGVDFNFFKNLIGTFSLSKQIFLYPNFLQTLPYEELRSGFAEMLKHGLVADHNHWNDLVSINNIEFALLEPFIEPSMRIKQNIVEQDFKEQNLRKILNFGHTIGHAIESLFLQKNAAITHGEAVALGMICETYLSYLEQLLDLQTAQNIIQNIQKYFPYISIDDFDNDLIFKLMQNDKKNTKHAISFSLLEGIGSSVYDYFPIKQNVTSALDFYKKLQSL